MALFHSWSRESGPGRGRPIAGKDESAGKAKMKFPYSKYIVAY